MSNDPSLPGLRGFPHVRLSAPGPGQFLVNWDTLAVRPFGWEGTDTFLADTARFVTSLWDYIFYWPDHASPSNQPWSSAVPISVIYGMHIGCFSMDFILLTSVFITLKENVWCKNIHKSLFFLNCKPLFIGQRYSLKSKDNSGQPQRVFQCLGKDVGRMIIAKNLCCPGECCSASEWRISAIHGCPRKVGSPYRHVTELKWWHSFITHDSPLSF